MEQVGNKGELKVSEWIRGSKSPWTDSYNKESLSYGNHRGRDINFWHRFMKQCYVLSLVAYKLKSMIKKSGFYAVHGIYHVSQKGKEAVDKDEPVILPVSFSDITSLKASSPFQSPGVYANHESKEKRVRNGKGCNILSVVHTLLLEAENWMQVVILSVSWGF